MDVKRKSLSPSSSSSSLRPAKKERASLSRKAKSCVICFCSPDLPVDDFHMFVLDLDSSNSSSVDVDGFIPRPPTLRIGRETFDDDRDVAFTALCVLGSTLYMAEGYNIRVINPPKGRNSVYAYNFSTLDDVSNMKLRRSMLQELPPMHRAKFFPHAIPTPDGKKFLVFSSAIGYLPPGVRAADKCDFELYDPADQSWRQLPNLVDVDDVVTRNIRIKMFTFTSETVLFLETEIGMFTLDLQLLDIKGWEQPTTGFYDALYIPRHVPRAGPFTVVGDEFCLTPLCAYDIRKRDGFSTPFQFPGLSSLSRGANYLDKTRRVSLLDVDDDDRECSFCIVHTELNEDTKYPHMIVDVYHCDLVEYRARAAEEEKWKMLPGTSMVKSFKFILNACQYEMFVPLFLFSTAAGTN